MESRNSLSLPRLWALGAGNTLEFYDFLIFTFFAAEIGAAFFPGSDTTSSLLLTLATYGAGFAMRPLGGAVLGTLGDTWGRKPAMLFSFSLMGTAMVGLALTPSFARIGSTAPMLAMVFRLLQGFALGGEVGPATALLLEMAPPHRRGFYVSLQMATQYASTLCVVAAVWLLKGLLPPAALAAWGWRIAFLIGAGVVPCALVIRRHLPETLHIIRARPTRRKGPAGGLMWRGLVGLCMIAGATIGTYIMSYMTGFAAAILGLPPGLQFITTIFAAGGALGGALLGGVLSDRVGRKPVMISANLVLLLTGVPWFLAMTQFPSLPLVLMGTAAMALCVGAGAAAVMANLAESMPVTLRAGAIGIIYALAIATFGGTTQFAMPWLAEEAGAIAPALYMSAAMLVALAGMLASRETAPVKA